MAGPSSGNGAGGGDGGGRNHLFLGTFIHSKTLAELEYLHDTAVCVDASGRIVAVEPGCDQEGAVSTLYGRLGWSPDDVAVTVAGPGQFFFPGFIDTHVHASQYPNLGVFGKSTLLDWLQRYTFPAEAALASLPRARRVYRRCIRRALAHGTTTAAYFATVHVPATNLLADLCLAAGQRAFVGRVCMDRLAPAGYADASAAAALAADRAVVAHVRAAAGPGPGGALVRPILTPRFAPACGPELLAGLGRLAREEALPVQTHLSENADEVALVAELFPGAASYADVYDRAGLLGGRTVLAHAIHLSAAEADLVAARGAGVAHCPCSNAALASGEARVRRLLDRGVNVGLGTDMSGGYSPSVLEAARHACLVSNHLAMPGRSGGGGGLEMEAEKDGEQHASKGKKEEEEERRRRHQRLSVDEVLYLATRGGAQILGLRDEVGGFDVGKQWDAQLIGLSRVPGGDQDGISGDEDEDDDRDDGGDGNVDLFGWETWEEIIAKWLFNGDDRNTKKVWVRGRLVHERR
ncbi:guanine deaminase [Xylariaceae sp. FL0804]|nr:guanine deaminase [Xylariaceae sp. FL0804]